MESEKLKLLKEFLAVSDSRGTLEKMRRDNVALLENTLRQNFGPSANHPLAQRIVERTMEKYTAFSYELFDWSKWEKKYIDLYEELFSEAELEGIIAFYKTDAGRAMIRVTPIMAKRMQQEMLSDDDKISARVNLIMEEVNSEFKDEIDSLQ